MLSLLVSNLFAFSDSVSGVPLMAQIMLCAAAVILGVRLLSS
jgi:hypothetical protein